MTDCNLLSEKLFFSLDVEMKMTFFRKRSENLRVTIQKHYNNFMSLII